MVVHSAESQDEMKSVNQQRQHDVRAFFLSARLVPKSFPKSVTVAITSNLAIRAWSIKCRRKKTNYTVWLEIARRTF